MAAGLGSKTFTTGSVLSASDVNGYLMQGVLVFASAAARDAAITAPAEGQYAYLKDTDATVFYNGSAWVVPSAGGMTLLETITFNGVASYTSASIAGTYKNISIVVRDYKPSVDGAKLNMRVNGISTTSYSHFAAFNGIGAFNQTSAEISNDMDNTVDNGLFTIDIPDYANAVTIKMIEAKSMGFDSTTPTSINFCYRFTAVNTTSAITTVTFLPTSGNITSGSALIYGVN